MKSSKIFKLIIFIFLVCAFALNAQETSLKINIIGKGEPIVFLPGFGCPGEVFQENIEELSKTHACHLISYPGFNGQKTVEDAWFKTVEKDIKKYIVNTFEKAPKAVGHSIGGTFLIKLASENKGLFKEMVLVDVLPGIAAVMMPGLDIKTIQYNSPQNNQMLAMTDTQFQGMTTGMVNFMSMDSSKHELMKSWFRKADRKTWVYGYTDLLKTDLREDLAQIDIPVSLIVAKNPHLANIEQTIKAQYAKLKKKDIYYAENSAHFVMFDQEEWFNQTLAKILD